MNATRWIAVLALCATTACHTSSSKSLGYLAGGALVLGGAVSLSNTFEVECGFQGCGGDEEAQATVSLLAVLAGTVIFAAAAMSDIEPEAPRSPPVPTASTAAARTVPTTTVVEVSRVPDFASVGEPPTADPELRRLTLQARVAARRGQCAGVKAIAVRVEGLDRGYREGGFVADAAVAACLR